ncbi:HAMP domain-containing histidine kinase [Desulfovibrio inopinatus]|uniref:HAMP domain-containing histidine kinase n=1 Tax=Desulfovibrio inopinatus TaxID=102109 RepID=UPI0004121252|nr:HAMP domain-containing histidine kinase [Desulfovibrio inopinatus]
MCPLSHPHDSSLAFYGRINASISHELKNVLAIVHETAGLLEDLCDMHKEEGALLDPERLTPLSTRILTQIRRGNGILKNMNTFAHSTDDAVAHVDVAEVVSLMIDLCERFAAMKRITLEKGRLESVALATSPFILEHLLFLCLMRSIESPDDNKNIVIDVDTRQGIVVRFSGLGPDPENALAGAEDLSKDLGAIVRTERSGELELVLKA